MADSHKSEDHSRRIVGGDDDRGKKTGIREREELSHIPVILLTARAELEDKLFGLAHGADDYLPKPFNRHELRARVMNLIEARQRLHERYRRQGRLRNQIPGLG